MIIFNNIICHIFKFVVITVLIPAAFYFEAEIKKIYPGYSAKLLLSGVIFLTGMAYYYATRAPVILLVVIAATIALPWLVEWIVLYWPST